MQDILDRASEQFGILVSEFKKELATVRTNRPHVGLIEDVKVLYYGESVSLKSLASLSVVPPREIVCSVYDKTAVSEVVRAIESLEGGFSVTQEGQVVRVFLPELTGERKEELVRYTKKLSEERKIEIRRIRDEANKKLQLAEDEGSLREDDKFRIKEALQKEVTKTNGELEGILAVKEKEILS